MELVLLRDWAGVGDGQRRALVRRVEGRLPGGRSVVTLARVPELRTAGSGRRTSQRYGFL